jgi:hypothetical protein
MGITITLVGGPADGQSMTIPQDEPPWTYFVPIYEPFEAGLITAGFDTPQMALAEYEPMRVGGWLSRDDDGTVRYSYRGTPAPIHTGQKRPSPSLEELAEMYRDPPPSSYPDGPSHLLACKVRFSLRRDARLNEAEKAVMLAGSWARIKAELAERRRREGDAG